MSELMIIPALGSFTKVKYHIDEHRAFQIARSMYYAVTHPMSYGNSAYYEDWIHWIEQTLNCSKDDAILIASFDKNNRLHHAHRNKKE